MSTDCLELTYKSMQCFSDDDRLDVDELDKLLSIALRDGVVDDDEKRVLNNIINRLSQDELDHDMKDKITEIKNHYN